MAKKQASKAKEWALSSNTQATLHDDGELELGRGVRYITLTKAETRKLFVRLKGIYKD